MPGAIRRPPPRSSARCWREIPPTTGRPSSARWPSTPALAGALVESSRDQTTMTAGRNTIIADTGVKYVGYLAGDPLRVSLDYSASCNIVFRGLAPARRQGVVQIINLSGTPVPGR